MKKRQFISMLLMAAFLLGVKDGYIALWKDGEQEPSHIFPYQAKMLPEADQKMLEKGIRLEEDSQLAQMLEDYLS